MKLLLKGIDEPGLDTLEVYARRGGYEGLRKALAMTPAEVLHELEVSAIRGRGGAGFAMGKKISFLPKGAMDKYLVCNADESEPGTFKDRELMQKSPHMLIEGIIIAAYAGGISRAFIYIRGEYELQAQKLEAAVEEAKAAGYLGRRILGSDLTLTLWVHRGAGAYICGEETALLDSLEGKRGNPRLKPPFPANQGLYRGPTLINNVETLATAPHIIRMGGEEYAKLGVRGSTGTKLVSVSGHVQRPGNYEIELGISSREIIYGLAGGPPEGREVKLWFPGGSSAPVLTKDDLDLAYDFDTLAKAGSMLGSGAIIVIDDSTSVVDVALKTARFYRHESCGKCSPCREGTNWTVKMLERIDSGEATPMDLDIMAAVQENIIGNCLCVLGDAMAMPIGSMIAKFRAEFEAHIEAARARKPAGGRRRGDHPQGGGVGAAPRAADRDPHHRRPRGVRVRELDARRRRQARRRRDPGLLLRAQARRSGRRLPHVPGRGRGHPQAADRCSTPVKDGMVVHTRTDRVKHAQEAVVEFLLVNLPLDCPVCDKGGECPLQDISFGWGGGRSRFIEPKRHFQKPLALSPLVAIDRERCILCYRCVRFSQEISEDYQLILEERGAHTYVSTLRRPPLRRALQRQHHRAVPGGGATSSPTASARARGTSRLGLGVHAVPAQCNVTFTVRDERVLRVLARDNADVDDGWLCDKGRFAYQSVHVDERITTPMIRDGGELRPVSWERAVDEVAEALARAKGRVGAIVGGETTNEEAFLLARLLREGLDSGDIDSRIAGTLPLELHRALSAPGAQATVTDLEFAHAVLVLDCEPVDDVPIVDLRIRKGVRRHAVTLGVATSRPSSLDRNAAASVRYAPGAGEAFVRALSAALQAGQRAEVDRLAQAAGAEPDAVRALARALQAGEDVVVLFGERLVSGPRGAHAARALLDLAGRLDLLGGRDGSGLLCVPNGANGRGLAEAGALPNAGPGYADPQRPGRDAAAIAAAARGAALTALYLLHADPVTDLPGRAGWEAALERATTVVAHAAFLTDGIREHATFVFPAESYAEKEGTLTHPDGRLQRLRPAIGHPGATRSEWSVIAEIARRVGLDLGVVTGSMATAQLVEAVPFYAGLTLDEIGGRGVRWPAREAAAAFPAAGLEAHADDEGAQPPDAALTNGRLRLGTFRSIWNATEVRVSPALHFLHPELRVEMAPADAQRLELSQGDHVVVGSDGHSVEATVTLRAATPEGSVFLETNALEGPLVEVRRV